MSIDQTRAIRESARWAVTRFVLVLEPDMPVPEAVKLAEGVLAMLTEWSVGGKRLPAEVNEFLTLAPWKR